MPLGMTLCAPVAHTMEQHMLCTLWSVVGYIGWWSHKIIMGLKTSLRRHQRHFNIAVQRVPHVLEVVLVHVNR